MSKESYIVLGAVIAALVSILTTLLSPRLANWKDKKEFKRKHNYEQLKELYLSLYGIVTQSEYVRYFFKKYRGFENELKVVPFFEITGSITRNRNGEVSVEVIQSAITEFNKENIVNKVIGKSEFASQRLLKLAVAYRYVHSNYQKNFDDNNVTTSFQEEELKLIYLIVKTIVKETNELLEECNMEYDGKEISYGIMNYNVFEDNER